MRLRYQIPLYILLCVALLVGALYLLFESVILREFSRVETAEMQEKSRALTLLVNKIITEFDEEFSDWNAWDDTAQFLADGNQAYKDENLTVTSLKDQLKISFFSLVQADGKIQSSVMVAPDGESLQPAFSDLAVHFTERALLRGAAAHGASFSGLLLLDSGAYVVASRPVLMTDGTPGPAAGRLIVGRRIDDAWVKRLEDFTFLEITLSLLRDVAASPQEQSARLALQSGSESFIASDPKESKAYVHLKDLTQEPILLLQVTQARALPGYARSLIESVVLFLVAGGALLAALSLLFMERQVLRPLSTLSQGVESLKGGAQQKVTPAKSYELGRLAVAFNEMASTIMSREADLRAKNDEQAQLFDAMSQGIIAFTPDGTIVGALSRQAKKIFGEGEKIEALLYPPDTANPHEAEAFREWLSALAESKASAWEELLALAPRALTLRAATEQEAQISLELRPLFDGERVARVMLVATDETERLRQERARQAMKEAHNKELEALRRLLGDAPARARFFRASRERLVEMSALVTRPDPASTQRLLRHAHTLKGEARIFQLTSLEASCAALEESITNQESALISERLSLVQEELRGAEQRLIESSPGGAAILSQVVVQQEALLSLEQAIKALPAETSQEVRALMATLQSQPFQEIAGPLATQSQSWAASLGKQLSATVKGGAVLVPSSILLRIQAALTHLTRNAVAHGVEPPEARRAAQKPPAGALLLSAEEGPLGPIFIVEDDGAGINIAALQKSSGSKSTDLLTLLSAGTSTGNVGGLSGLGVGVSAAREELSAAQYRLEVTSSMRGTRFLLRPVG